MSLLKIRGDSVVYDRDYYCDEEIYEILGKLQASLKLAHVHERKEIENYLLVPNALDRAIQKAISERITKDEASGGVIVSSLELLMEITEDMRDDAEAQFLDKYSQYFRGTKKVSLDGSTLNKAAMKQFRARWGLHATRLNILSGKEILQKFRTRISEQHGVSLSDARIIDSIRVDEIAPDLVDLLKKLNDFRSLAAAKGN